jgi:carboxynorspermidine decarboxylase
MLNFDPNQVETPCYVIDLGALRKNLKLLARVQEEAECKILLALKAYAAWSTFPLIRQYLPGVAASSLAEAELGAREFGGEVHACAPAYSENDFKRILQFADHVVFNSSSQLARLRPLCEQANKSVSWGIRINPEHSEVKVALYDPCAPCSRLGMRLEDCQQADLTGLSGLHFHTLCELGADALERTLRVVEQRFGAYLARVDWVNFGGGHHITRQGYDVALLIRLIQEFKRRHGVDVYLEPGEAVVLNAGYLVTSVLDTSFNQTRLAILDSSATAHMPDVLEMPYRPGLVGAAMPGEKEYTYRLGGTTCLAGDVIGDYSFDRPLVPGDRLVFTDMACYTMVKNTTFNGVRLPSIATFDPAGNELRVHRRFGYEDYKNRLS